MCGIVGIVNLHPSAPPVDTGLVGRMCDIIAHRGPDDAGVYCSPDGCAALGNRRLAIIDLSPAGHQPMSNEDGNLWIAYNGEVYNFADYRAGLIERGHRLTSQSDTEVILHLYEEDGPEVVHKLRGMFAIAIWDERRRELFLARDRIGVKPLYYAFAGGQFVFGSEIKALLLHPAISRRVDEEAFYHFLSFLTSPAPRTLFEGIYKLPPGHHALLTADGKLRIEEWWDVFDSVPTPPDPATCADDLISTLRQSIRLRMVSDVPFGVFLSGGIDSSTNVALMDELMDRPVQTFSIGYTDHESYNEFRHARRVADHFGADHHEVLIGVDDLMRFLPGLVWHQDEPIADPVCVPIYYVSKLARESGTIVIQVGEGADELFAGYTHWLKLLNLERGAWQAFRRLPLVARRLALAFAPLKRNSPRYEYVRRAACNEELFWGGAEAFGEARKSRLLSKAMRRRLDGLTSWDVIRPYRRRFEERSPRPDDYLAWMGYLDLRLRLPELLLMRVDKMTMATSVEARVPYLDHEFVALAMSLPVEVKLDGGVSKAIFKRAVRGLIPDEIIDRPKHGFSVPVYEWLQDRLGPLARAELTEFTRRTDYFNPGTVQAMLNRHDPLTWYLLNFALWHALWIEGDGDPASLAGRVSVSLR